MEFLKEAESMISLSHPNIVQLVGVAVQQRPWLTVLEFIEVRIGSSCFNCCRPPCSRFPRSIPASDSFNSPFAIPCSTGICLLFRRHAKRNNIKWRRRSSICGLYRYVTLYLSAPRELEWRGAHACGRGQVVASDFCWHHCRLPRRWSILQAK